MTDPPDMPWTGAGWIIAAGHPASDGSHVAARVGTKRGPFPHRDG